MLILTRKSGEGIRIGDNITLKVIEIRGNQVRLGIDAPRSVQVHRKEVYDAIKRENADASRVQVDDLTAADKNLKQMGKPDKNTRPPREK